MKSLGSHSFTTKIRLNEANESNIPNILWCLKYITMFFQFWKLIIINANTIAITGNLIKIKSKNEYIVFSIFFCLTSPYLPPFTIIYKNQVILKVPSSFIFKVNKTIKVVIRNFILFFIVGINRINGTRIKNINFVEILVKNYFVVKLK